VLSCKNLYRINEFNKRSEYLPYNDLIGLLERGDDIFHHHFAFHFRNTSRQKNSKEVRAVYEEYPASIFHPE
jgi:hypothetical protein